MDITAPAVHEHEIAKHSDFQEGFESIIRNTAILDRMLVSAETDYIIGGKVTPEAGELAVRVGKMWGNGQSLDIAVYNSDISDPVPLATPVSDSRTDTLQLQAVLEEYDEQRRAFFNPETESGQYFTTPTKKRLKIKCVVVQGAEGQDIAPEAGAGWLKIAEILLSPGMTEVPPENIRNVTAIYQGEENTEWTNQKKRTFSLGSTLELKTILALEHTVSGEHRERVIHAGNVDFGTGGNQVNAKKIPLGEDYNVGTDQFIAAESIFTSLIKEAGYRRSNFSALELVIRTIIQTISDMVHEAPNDGAIYGRKNNSWMEVTSGSGGTLGDAIEALKLYSKKTLMITNTRIADRRKRRRDIGIPYLSAASRVYHFDTDLNDQYQETSIEIANDGDDPALVSVEETNGEVYFNPAVLAIPPYEMKGRSLYGNFSLKTTPKTFTETFTAEAWIRLFSERAAIVFSIGSGMESVTLRSGTKDAPECEYSGAEQDGIEYSGEEPPIGYSEAEADGIEYSGSEDDGIEYSGAEPPIGYSEAGTDPGNIVIHKWLDGEEMESLDDNPAVLAAVPRKTWLHVAAVSTPDIIALYIGGKKIEFEKKSEAAGPFSLSLNPAKNEFNVDEILLDETAAVEFEGFEENTEGRVPYAALDHREKWFVLEAQSPDKVKTNLFETEQFRAAVQAVIDSNTQGV